MAAFLLLVAILVAASGDAPHHKEFQWLLPLLLLTILAAVANLVTKLNFPDVLGYLVAGCLLVNLDPTGLAEKVSADPVIVAFGELGILVLLFNSGLESSVTGLLQAGPTSMRVATVGVVLPLIGGMILCGLLFGHASVPQMIFFGSTLTATSVGITMKVLSEKGIQKSREGQVILGAAVIDDVLGLMILAINQKLVSGGDYVTLAFEAAKVVAVAAGFFAAAAAFGERISNGVAWLFARLGDSVNLKISFALSWMFLLSWCALKLHLEAILGAFAAGWVLAPAYFTHFAEADLGRMIKGLVKGIKQLPEGPETEEVKNAVKEIDEHYHHVHFEQILHSITALSVAVFFVLVGTKIKLNGLGWNVFFVSVVVGVMAVATKYLAGRPEVTRDKSLNGKMIGIGMVPRGEVGIVFANIGLASAILTQEMFTGLVLVIIATTVIAIIGLSKIGENEQQKT